MICANCGQETQGADCQWCHYPLIAGQSTRVEVVEETKKKSAWKGLTWAISIALTLIIGGFALIHFSPDYDLYLVRSESMKPAVNMGDMIVTGPTNGPLNGEIEPGAIVTYEHGKELITHRVMSVDGDNLVTKGDAAEEPDPWSVTLSNVKGIYMFKIPYVGYVLNFIRSKLGWFLVIILPAVLLVGLLVKEIVKEAWKSSPAEAIPSVRSSS